MSGLAKGFAGFDCPAWPVGSVSAVGTGMMPRAKRSSPNRDQMPYKLYNSTDARGGIRCSSLLRSSMNRDGSAPLRTASVRTASPGYFSFGANESFEMTAAACDASDLGPHQAVAGAWHFCQIDRTKHCDRTQCPEIAYQNAKCPHSITNQKHWSRVACRASVEPDIGLDKVDRSTMVRSPYSRLIIWHPLYVRGTTCSGTEHHN
jgi:hypothetical protein